MAKKTEIDSAMFEDMGEEELKTNIVNNVKKIKQLQSDLKTYKAGISESISEFEARIDVALEALARLKNELPPF